MQQHKETLEKGLFFQIGTEKLIELSLATFGLYGLVWSYQNWVQLKRQDPTIKPLLRTLLAIVYQLDLYQRVHKQSQADRESARWSPIRVYILFVIFNLIPTWLLVTGHPWGFLVIMLTLLPNLLVNQAINRIHDKRIHFYAQNTELDGLDWGVLIAGIVIWLTILVMAIS
ncbi:hypothetical protein [Bacterioplanoides sp.]|uniref:hypothetical protein n=1 Tax=Bacterioplanoides sp. TaxID=2066072 RepID=UPI003B5BA689